MLDRTWRGGLAALAITVAVTAVPARAVEEPDFQYSGGTGPAFWEELEGAEACGRSTEPGARQSPIDISEAVVDPGLRPLQLRVRPTRLRLVNNGHQVEAKYEPGSFVLIDGVAYELLQFHFHTLAEHAIAGQRGALEMHAVFRDAASGKLAVIGQMFRLGPQSDFLRDVLALGLPQRAGEVVEGPRTVNLAEGLRNRRAYFTYEGSLTTPPCTETVTWYVLRTRPTLSRSQLDAFIEVAGNNFRPLQARNGRVVRAAPFPVEAERGGE
jgi:carbonic anhydrase